jgi:hypothetical protein
MTLTLAEFVDRSNVTEVGYKTGLPFNQTHPKGWEPGVVWHGGGGVGISQPRRHDGSEVDHASLLREWGFDPTLYAVEGPLEYRQWDASTQLGTETFRYYKAKIVPRIAEDYASLPDLINQIRKHKKMSRVPPTGEGAFCVFLSDWQLGKGEGDGTEGTIGRLMRMIDGVEERIKELRRIGRALGSLYVFGLGDIVEGCTGFYCVAADTPVLNRDLEWVPAGRLRPGDQLYSVEEEGRSNNSRKYQFGEVTAHQVVPLPSVRVHVSNGDEFVCTPEHPVLARPVRRKGGPAPYRWVRAADLMSRPYEVPKMFSPWERGISRDHGWLAGLFVWRRHL